MARQLFAGDTVTTAVVGADGLERYRDEFVVAAESQSQVEQVPTEPWITDIRSSLPVNRAPDYDKDAPKEEDRILYKRGWWLLRTLSEIDGVTIHNTVSTSPSALAAWTTRAKASGGKGMPTLQYQYWVGTDGAVSYCVDLENAVWNDHTGDRNTHISIGMSGRWDSATPSLVQLDGVARLCALLMRTFGIPVESVRGHREWAATHNVSTDCPGWIKAGWKDTFYQRLAIYVNDPTGEPWAFPVGTKEFPAERWYAATVHDPTGVANGGYKHTGLDLNLDVAPYGDVDFGMPVYAIARGIVSYATNSWSGVPMLVVRHEHNGAPLYARYAHINLLVTKDMVVNAGQAIGTIADWKGKDAGDHLHFDMALDPFTTEWLTESIRWVDPVPVLNAHLDASRVSAMLKRG